MVVYHDKNPVGMAISYLLGNRPIGDFADQMGRARITVYRWLSGQRSPSMTELPRMAESLHCTPAELANCIAKFDKAESN